MNLFFGMLGISAVLCLLKFLLALHTDRPMPSPRSVTIYLAEQNRPGIQKIEARRYSTLTVMDGGTAKRRAAVAASATPSSKGPVQPILWSYRPVAQMDVRRQG